MAVSVQDITVALHEGDVLLCYENVIVEVDHHTHRLLIYCDNDQLVSFDIAEVKEWHMRFD